MAWADKGVSYGGKIGKVKYTLTTVATTATGVCVAGAWKHMLVTIPTLVGSTATITIDDEDGKEIWTSGLLTESLDHSIPLSRFLTGKETLELTLTTTQNTVSVDVIVKVWFVGDI